MASKHPSTPPKSGNSSDHNDDQTTPPSKLTSASQTNATRVTPKKSPSNPASPNSQAISRTPTPLYFSSTSASTSSSGATNSLAMSCEEAAIDTYLMELAQLRRSPGGTIRRTSEAHNEIAEDQYHQLFQAPSGRLFTMAGGVYDEYTYLALYEGNKCMFDPKSIPLFDIDAIPNISFASGTKVDLAEFRNLLGTEIIEQLRRASRRPTNDGQTAGTRNRRSSYGAPLASLDIPDTIAPDFFSPGGAEIAAIYNNNAEALTPPLMSPSDVDSGRSQMKLFYPPADINIPGQISCFNVPNQSATMNVPPSAPPPPPAIIIPDQSAAAVSPQVYIAAINVSVTAADTHISNRPASVFVSAYSSGGNIPSTIHSAPVDIPDHSAGVDVPMQSSAPINIPSQSVEALMIPYVSPEGTIADGYAVGYAAQSTDQTNGEYMDSHHSLNSLARELCMSPGGSHFFPLPDGSRGFCDEDTFKKYVTERNQQLPVVVYSPLRQKWRKVGSAPFLAVDTDSDGRGPSPAPSSRRSGTPDVQFEFEDDSTHE